MHTNLDRMHHDENIHTIFLIKILQPKWQSFSPVQESSATPHGFIVC